MGNAEAAQRLSLKTQAVQNNLPSLAAKLGTRTSHEAVSNAGRAHSLDGRSTVVHIGARERPGRAERGARVQHAGGIYDFRKNPSGVLVCEILLGCPLLRRLLLRGW